MSGHVEVKVDPELEAKLQEMAQKIVDTLAFGINYPSGPQIVIQAIMMTMLRIGRISNDDIFEKLQNSLRISHMQIQAERLDS